MPEDASASSSLEPNRGRRAKQPEQIPAIGWKDVLWRSWHEVSDNSLFLIAGGVTYAVLVALFPALAALVSIYGLVLDPAQIEAQLDHLSTVLPEQSRRLLGDQLHQLGSTSSHSLGISAGVALLIALWSASRGMSGMINALNIAYGEKETRGFIKLNLMALGLTLALIIGGLVVIALVAVLPAVVSFLGLGDLTQWLLLILEWPLLIVVVLGGLAALYRYAPARREPQWRWVTPGSLAASGLWLIGSVGFTLYVANFANYNATYGSLGGVIVMLTWLYLSAFVVLLGAAINAQAERQTVKDTTIGPPKPLGDRDAYAADTVGPQRGDHPYDANAPVGTGDSGSKPANHDKA